MDHTADGRLEENIVLCGANSYVEKYYFNEQFAGLPEGIKEELRIMCVLFTEDVGGVMMLEFAPDGTLEFRIEAEETDYLFDEIGSGLKVKQYQREKRELLESLELYYKVFILGMPAEQVLEEQEEDGEEQGR